MDVLWAKQSCGEAGDGMGWPHTPQGYRSKHPSPGSLGMGVTFSHAEEELLWLPRFLPQCKFHTTVTNTESQNGLGQKGPSEITYPSPLPWSGTSVTRSVTTSSDGASTTFLGNLCQCLTTFTVNNFFLMTSLSLPSFNSLKPLPVVLSQQALLKSCNKVSLKPSLLQAEQPQLSQPFFTGEVFQPYDHFRGPPLDPLQQVRVFLVLGTPVHTFGLLFSSGKHLLKPGTCSPCLFWEKLPFPPSKKKKKKKEEPVIHTAGKTLPLLPRWACCGREGPGGETNQGCTTSRHMLGGRGSPPPPRRVPADKGWEGVHGPER
ncbi:hypothetical protein QYF61_008676 [Mycteria americana]|uniref:Uncharacterized protein n=1 Tax=Mycteria americana TaxID=33587 RepID=A0AAN7S6A8_MYCAM|nr:hypothetical protein QYF61_008676 [Mycteria americana]